MRPSAGTLVAPRSGKQVLGSSFVKNMAIRGCCVWQQSEVGRVGQKDVNSSGAKPGCAVLCWLVGRFVAVMTVIN